MSWSCCRRSCNRPSTDHEEAKGKSPDRSRLFFYRLPRSTPGRAEGSIPCSPSLFAGLDRPADFARRSFHRDGSPPVTAAPARRCKRQPQGRSKVLGSGRRLRRILRRKVRRRHRHRRDRHFAGQPDRSRSPGHRHRFQTEIPAHPILPVINADSRHQLRDKHESRAQSLKLR